MKAQYELEHVKIVPVIFANISEAENILDVPHTAMGWDSINWPVSFNLEGDDSTYTYRRSEMEDDGCRVAYREYRNSEGRIVRVR